MERPHFLRVVQALSFVSGFGPVAVVAGATFLGCGSSTSASQVADASAPPADAAPDAVVGITTGTLPACELDEAGSCVDASVVSTGVSIPPDAGDDAHHLPPVGGP